MKISVIGTGYLGATHAACMAELGFDVLGVDVDESKVQQLQRGEVPFYEPGLEPLLRKHVENGNLAFTTDLAAAATWAEVHFVCVGTPQRTGSLSADTSYVEQAVEEIAPHLRPGALVVGKSTVPVGTAARLRERLARGLPPGVHADLVWNPEFLREGKAVGDTLRPDRLVVGSDDGAGVATLREVYAEALGRGTPLLVTNLETAELVKVAANSFLATKISFVNAMAEVCEAVGGDVVALAEAIGHDERIGHRFLGAGLGFGGGCLPKDIRAFQARCTELGLTRSVSFLAQVDEVNQRRRDRTVALAHELLGGRVKDRRVAVLGAAFKPDSDDVRDSPALDVADQLYVRGGDVVVYDPQATDTARRRSPDLVYAASLGEAVSGADLVMVLTEWQEFTVMDPGIIGDRVRQRAIIDGRNVLDTAAWRSQGWTLRALGRTG